MIMHGKTTKLQFILCAVTKHFMISGAII